MPDAQEWVNDLPNAANKKFVADYMKKYRPQAVVLRRADLRAAQPDRFGGAAVKGNLADKNGGAKAMDKANFKSVRGNFNYGNNHFPIQNFYLQEVVAGRRRRAQDR